MSRWTHNYCAECWEETHGLRQPVVMRDVNPEACCRCGRQNTDGIYVCGDPSSLPCGGKHEETP